MENIQYCDDCAEQITGEEAVYIGIGDHVFTLCFNCARSIAHEILAEISLQQNPDY